MERDGVPVYGAGEAGKASVSFSGYKATFLDGDAVLRGTFRLDATSSPKAIDLIVHESDAGPARVSGIYSLGDADFRLCFAFPAGDRPTRFETRPGSGRTATTRARSSSTT